MRLSPVFAWPNASGVQHECFDPACCLFEPHNRYNLKPQSKSRLRSGLGGLDVAQMNTLAIALTDRSSDDGEDYTGVQIFIDGVDLHAMIRDYELPMAKREDAKRIAGDYFVLDAETVDRAYFLGEAVREYGIPLEKVALMGCCCGVVACWPLLARIRISKSSIFWEDFEQPYRSSESEAGFWDYSEFGPFEFDRTQYMDALSLLEKGV